MISEAAYFPEVPEFVTLSETPLRGKRWAVEVVADEGVIVDTFFYQTLAEARKEGQDMAGEIGVPFNPRY